MRAVLGSDLDAYFARIGWRGPRTATGDVLAGLVAHHVRAIPFENLDVLLGRTPRLDVDSLVGKLVRGGRGGYCYEHATLFAAVLRELGFTVHAHSARVVMVTPRERAPRTHMFLTVGDLVVDPGFGGAAPLVPVPLDGTQAGDHRIEKVIVDERGLNEFILIYMNPDSFNPHGEREAPQRLWISSLARDLPIDFEMANHFTATYASSPFVQRLMARAFTADGKVSVMNRDVTIVRGGQTHKRQLADRAELRAVFAEHFAIDLPELERLRIPSVQEWAE